MAESDRRREWLSGFSGSAGTAVVTAKSAFIWTDGRYTLQASQQCDPTVWEVHQVASTRRRRPCSARTGTPPPIRPSPRSPATPPPVTAVLVPCATQCRPACPPFLL